MAKQQTFADKVKKKKAEELGTQVKVIKAYRTDKGNMRFMERFVKVMDLNELTNIDVQK
jgi:hypothetical protein